MKSFLLAGCLSVALLSQGIYADTVMSSVGVIPRHLAAHAKATQLSLDTLSGSTTFEEARAKAAQLQAALKDNHDQALNNLFMAWAESLQQYFADEAEVTASYEAFVKSVKDMVHHNLNPQQSHWRGLNKFSGSTRNLFTLKGTFGVTGKCPKVPLGSPACAQVAGADPPKYDVTKPANPAIDWRAKGLTSAVKDQGGSCNGAWANAAVTAIDSAFGIASNSTPLPFSRQEILSCLTTKTLPGSNSNGCTGGNTDDAIDFLQLNSVTAESTYPYTSASGAVAACASKYLHLNKTNNGSVPWVGLGCTPPNPCGTSGYQGLQKASASFLVRAVGGSAIVGSTKPWGGQPVLTYWSFLEKANPNNYDMEFLNYAGGIFNGSVCYTVTGTPADLKYLNHVMVIVGYNLSAPVPYWTLQNSFGASWGQGGLIQVAYTANKVGPCGMYTMLSAPNLNFLSGHIPKKPITHTCIDGSKTATCSQSLVVQCAALSATACAANAICNAPPYNFCPEQ